ISAVIEPSGRIAQQTHLFTQTVLFHSVHVPQKGMNFYMRFGNWLAYVCIFVFAVGFVLSAVLKYE
ncbi:MAG: hypothetical protein IKO35_04675, partial [Elusimicrobiaceae bacterium]|nr:hypothetical protein [Elusimicrobiaceae bacterium]